MTGRVLHVSQQDSTPVAGQWVVLHRVTLSGGSPVDSQRTNSCGVYRVGAPERDTLASYLASVTYQGIAYFADPLPGRGPAVDTAQTLLVYDTSSTAPPIQLVQRHLVIRTADEDGSRHVVEFLVLGNRGTRTRITNDTSRPVWEGAIPDGVVGFEVGESDVGPEAIELRDSRLAVVAPMPPGERQLLVGYLVPRSERDLTVFLDQPVERFTVLIEDTTATVSGGGLEFRGVQTFGELVLREFGAEMVAAGTTVRVRFRGARRAVGDFRWLFIGVMTLVMVAGLMWWWWSTGAAVAVDDPESLAARIAELDRRYAGRETHEYRRERAALRRRLAELLAQRDAGR